jgi:hypothetical protein
LKYVLSHTLVPSYQITWCRILVPIHQTALLHIPGTCLLNYTALPSWYISTRLLNITSLVPINQTTQYHIPGGMNLPNYMAWTPAPFYQTTCCHFPENHDHDTHYCKNLKSRIQTSPIK